MAKEKVTRKELLKGTDEFMSIAGRVAVYLREHSRQLQYAGLGVLVLVVLYLAINTFLGYINKKGEVVIPFMYEDAFYFISLKEE